MGFRAMKYAVRSIDSQQGTYDRTLILFFELCDDKSDPDKHSVIGGNVYPSINNIAIELGVDRSSIKRSIRKLKEDGWIRERKTRRYIKTFGSVEGTVPVCYQVNINMLIRVISMKSFMKTNSIKPGTDEYKHLMSLTEYKDDDWVTPPDEKMRLLHLHWNGPFVTADDTIWDQSWLIPSEENNALDITSGIETQPTHEEINEQANRYRINTDHNDNVLYITEKID